jgi:sulfotransferase family protein
VADASDLLAPLDALDRARSSIAAYYLPLIEAADETVRVGAWLTLLSTRSLPLELYSAAVAYARYGAVKRIAFDFFEDAFAHELSAEVAAALASSARDAEDSSIRAELSGDLNSAAAAQRQLYLASGQIDALFAETEFTYQAEGPLAAIELAVRNVVINPHEPMGVVRLLQFCAETREAERIEAVVRRLDANGLHARIAAVFAGAVHLLRHQPQPALDALQRATAISAPPDVVARLQRTVLRLRAESLDKLGDFEGAYQAYREMNLPPGEPPPNTQMFHNSVLAAARFEIPKLPADDRNNWFILTGFARSGTTLLEFALDAHPQIEAFEEPPTRQSVRLFLDRTLARSNDRAAAFIEARSRYYAEMSRRRRKAQAQVFVDKSPMASADARFNARLFPDKRYLFAVRHPYDVVLSCFRQDFAANMAMDNFRNFEDAVRLYDFAMSEWFSQFSLADRRVHYVRYDDLVTRFEATLRSALDFMGVTWDLGMLDFSADAEGKAGRTPSYQKVRQGLSIGVQTSWRNYRFLFETEAARPLRKWVAHFGYDAP